MGFLNHSDGRRETETEVKGALKERLHCLAGIWNPGEVATALARESESPQESFAHSLPLSPLSFLFKEIYSH